MRTMFFALVLLAPLAAATAGCGNDNKQTGGRPAPRSAAMSPPPVASEAPMPTPTASVPQKTAPHVEVQIASVANQMNSTRRRSRCPQAPRCT